MSRSASNAKVIHQNAEGIGKRLATRPLEVMPASFNLSDALPRHDLDAPRQLFERQAPLPSERSHLRSIYHQFPPSDNSNDRHLSTASDEIQEKTCIVGDGRYDCPMHDGMTGAEALELLRKHTGLSEIVDLQKATGLTRSTLDGWARRRDSKINVLSRKKLQLVLSGQRPEEPKPKTTVPSLDGLISEVNELKLMVSELLARAGPQGQVRKRRAKIS